MKKECRLLTDYQKTTLEEIYNGKLELEEQAKRKTVEIQK